MNMSGLSKGSLRFACAAMALSALAAAPARAGEGSSTVGMLREMGKAFASVARKASPAVVFIKVEKTAEGGGAPFDGPPGELFRHFSPGRRPPAQRPRQMGQGSGLIISSEGHILTNNHVVVGADRVTVKLADGRELRAKIVGTDPRSDIAVVKIDAEGLPVLPLGSSDDIEVGEWVIAIGNPFGLSHTVTAGILSAKGRSSVGITDYEDFLQTDAAINPGNSGGPLLNLDGEVVGINTAIFSRSGGYMGIGFAIPINMVKAIYKQLVETGTVTRGYLGVMIQDLNAELAASFDLKGLKGVLIAQVLEDGAAAKAGLKPGDVVVELDGSPVAKVGAFRNRIAALGPGSKAEIVVIRNGQRKVLGVTVGALPSGEPATSSKADSLEKLGISVQDLTDEIASRFNYEGEMGVIVTQVEEGSLAALAGIRPGMLIKEVDRKSVSNLGEFNGALSKSLKGGKGEETVLLLVRSGRFSRYVALRIGD